MSTFFYTLFAYVLICKIWPYFAYPNYFKKSKIENYPEIQKLATRLKRNGKKQTIESIYNYMVTTYSGYDQVNNFKNLLSIFYIGDYSTKNILHQKRFLWCHTQNRLLKSILINTGLFTENEIIIKRKFLKSFFIHQWIEIILNNQIIIIDPYYKVFKVNKRA